MRRTSWILVLMLALLPLRGWALAGMGLGLPTAAQATQAAALQGEATAAMPCHTAAADAADGGAAPAASTTCQACDACHTALAMPPAVELPATPPLRDVPARSIHRDTGRALIDGLERPPRSFLA
ncbi:MAG TPA: hypothetical protein VFR90_04590 [Methylibium sp.]|uniref:hypothetical protein n=1 Tax=Methylibium sp. TaxID=2067992 RepID=UPI002DBA7DFB|nr:hypothetical protein [Methylibium sp.]HEU4458379.1 hypothetical protein [Methylibium sp.]